MKSMASCVLARMSLSWSTLKHPLCGHPGILWPCWSLLIGTVSNFAWGAMLRPANSLFQFVAARDLYLGGTLPRFAHVHRWGLPTFSNWSNWSIAHEVGLLHEASEVILLLSKTALYTWWAHHGAISCHIVSYRANHVCFLHVFWPGDSGCLGNPWNAGNSMVMALHAHALLATLQPPGQRRAKWEQVCPYRRREPK